MITTRAETLQQSTQSQLFSDVSRHGVLDRKIEADSSEYLHVRIHLY